MNDPRIPAPHSTPRALVLRHIAFEDAGLVGDVLSDHGWSVAEIDATTEPVGPATAADPDLLVVLGGPVGVHDADAYPWLADELAAVRDRLDRGRPLLGVCLGAQLIAQAAGGGVEPAGNRPKEIGYFPVDLVAEGPDAGGPNPLAALEGVPVLHWHGDRIVAPAEATTWASTRTTDCQAFTLGPAVLGVQFHVEADHEGIERWLTGHALEMALAGVDPRGVRADAAEHGPRLRDAALEALGAWVGGLPVHG